MRTFSHWRSVSICLLLVGLADCSGTSDSSSKSAPTSNGDFASGAGGSSSGLNGSATVNPGAAGGAGSAVVAPPEMEVEKAFEAPVATGHFVWAANPKTGRVALINSETFQVKTVSAGEGPTYITAIPDPTLKGDRAIVINVLSSDATYLSQGADGQLDQKTFPLTKGSNANSWAISPDGHYAIAWTDVSRISNPDQFDGFQTISIIDLTGSAAVRQSVGFRPSSISFAATPPRAFAVTDDGISVVDLAAPTSPVKLIKYPAPSGVTAPPPEGSDAGSDAATAVDAGEASANVQAPPDPVAPGKADVSITPDGAYAIIRRDNSSVVNVIDLAKEKTWSWPLSGSITDLDLSDTGLNAVAVVRSSSSVSVLPVPGSAQTVPTEIHIEGETIGAVVIAPQGKTALLYTNAVAVNRLTVLHLDDSTYDVIDLHAPVLAVFPSPTAQHAIVIHNNSIKGQPPLSTKPGAFSVVPLSGNASPVIQTTDAPPMSVSLSPQGDRAIIPARDSAQHIYLTYLAHLSSGIVDRFELASPPTAAGFVGENGQAFIAQDHPEGRVTFIDPATGQVRTITGFELGASVIEWSQSDGGSK